MSLPVAQVSGSQFGMLAIVAVVTTFSLIAASRRRQRGVPSPRAYVREHLTAIKEEKAVRSDLADIMIQLQQVAREINAQLDAKFRRLERCICEADERIDRLSRIKRGAEGQPVLDVTVCDESSVPVDRVRPTDGELNRGEIFDMADRGLSAVEIADETHKPVGEIELMIALRRRKKTAV